ncbi:MAG: DUF4143 domain-containing protein [Actinobacteria bacterium]|jgi:predicted AAA+ superfamily ATPase|nr:DUF4143 domain-containing protein [Actinomycetota bacterium]
MPYLPRVADGELVARLGTAGAVLVEGPKFCGKTETARRAAGSEVLLDVDRAAREAVLLAPDLVLGQQPPQLLDEWQIVPELWDLVRREVDARRIPGQFILTGSATPTGDARRHSGAGRFSVMRMRPMCLAESRRSDATVSLDSLLDGDTQPAKDPGLTIADLAEALTRGGWPALVDQPVATVTRSLRDYLTQATHVDVLTVAGPRRDPVKVDALVRSLARNTATEVSVTTLAADAAVGGSPLDRSTVTDYLTALERLMILDQQPAWAPSMRSRAQLRTSPKRHLADPSLAVAAMRGSPSKLLGDLATMGTLFESLVVRDLRVLAEPLDGSVYHYRDNKGLEVGAIVQCDDGRWGAFEVKLGTSRTDAAAATLLAFAAKVDTTATGEPGVLAVITGQGFAYRRPDGVHVVPIGTLGP